MKRIIALILTLALALPLAACGGAETTLVEEGETETLLQTQTTVETAEDAGVHEVTGFSAGFGRGDITPTTTVPLGGYGNSSYRMSQNILDPLYATCFALQDENGERMLIYQLDLGNPRTTFAEQIFKLLEKETGIPRDHVLLNATHTHSGTDINSGDGGIGLWKNLAYKAIVQAAKDALADLDTCTAIYAGTTMTDRLNFVRRYYKENGFVCDNADYGTGEITGHETPADEEMRIVRFDRKNQPDLILANWQCHNHRTGGSSKYDISSDFVGVFQKQTEKNLGVKMLYLQGGGGNINPSSKISGEARFGNYTEIGRALYEHLAEGLDKNMKEVEMGAIRTETGTLTGKFTHEKEDMIPQCQEISAIWATNDRPAARALCAQYGISSAFEANAIIARAKRGEGEDIHVICYAIGDLGIAAAPFEMFCQTYQDLRAKSPFAMTLTCGYSNDSQGYMPAAECYPNQGYEVVTCKYVQGTAEQIEAKQLEILNELKTK